MSERWSRFWFADAPYFDLALMRILFVSLQLLLLLLDGFEGIHYAAALPDSMWLPIPALKLSAPLAWGERPSLDLVMAVFWGTFMVGLFALVGWFSQAATLVFAYGNVYLQAYQYSFGEIHHSSAIMMIALLVIGLGPCGRVLSVDDWRKSRIMGADTPRAPVLELSGPDAGWPIRLMQCFIPLMYLSAGLAKLTLDGKGWSLEWANGVTLQKYLAIDGARWGSSLGVWASQFHLLAYAAQWVVLIFQLTYVVTAFSVRMRWVYLPLGILFHVVIYLTLRAGFPQWVIASAFYVPWAAALLQLTRSSSIRSQPLA